MLKYEDTAKTVWDGMDETKIKLNVLELEENFAAKAPVIITMPTMTKSEP